MEEEEHTVWTRFLDSTLDDKIQSFTEELPNPHDDYDVFAGLVGECCVSWLQTDGIPVISYQTCT